MIMHFTKPQRPSSFVISHLHYCTGRYIKGINQQVKIPMRFLNLEVTRISEEFSSIICRLARWFIRTSVSPCQTSAQCHDSDYHNRRYSNACYYRSACFMWQDVRCFRSSSHDSIRQNLTNLMDQSTSWKAKRSSAGQDLSSFYGTQRFITMFTTARKLSVYLDKSIQSMPLRTL